MLLCIDVGNTQIALGLYPEVAAGSHAARRPRLVRDWRMRTDPRITADELEVAIRGMLGEHADHITGVAAELGWGAGGGVDNVTVLATGGLAPLVIGVSETITEHVPDLTLLGLWLVYLRSTRSTVVRMGSSNSPDDISGRLIR